MPAFVFHQAATVLCSHAGQATPITPFPRVTLGGQSIVTLASPYALAGCSLSGSGTPPCATGQFLTGAMRVTAGGAFVVTQAGSSVCVPTGTPLHPLTAQVKVVAS